MCVRDYVHVPQSALRARVLAPKTLKTPAHETDLSPRAASAPAGPAAGFAGASPLPLFRTGERFNAPPPHKFPCLPRDPSSPTLGP
jgi:hypothetical protein